MEEYSMFKKNTDEKNTDDRFVVIYEQGLWSHFNKIIVDTQTGVHYLYSSTGSSSGGITPLLDKEGKVLIDLDSVEIE